MATTAEQVIKGLIGLIEAAVPHVHLVRNPAKEQSLKQGALLCLFDGDRGEPEILLSPMTYSFNHAVQLEIWTEPYANFTAEALQDQILSALGPALIADRTVGGLCDHLEPRLDGVETVASDGAVPVRISRITLTCSYTTPSPL